MKKSSQQQDTRQSTPVRKPDIRDNLDSRKNEEFKSKEEVRKAEKNEQKKEHQ